MQPLSRPDTSTASAARLPEHQACGGWVRAALPATVYPVTTLPLFMHRHWDPSSLFLQRFHPILLLRVSRGAGATCVLPAHLDSRFKLALTHALTTEGWFKLGEHPQAFHRSHYLTKFNPRPYEEMPGDSNSTLFTDLKVAVFSAVKLLSV
ncbi:uncharacterized protein LOC144503651 isoform X2 [Mustelus asterias]